MTPLLAAAVTGHIHIVEHLISKGEQTTESAVTQTKRNNAFAIRLKQMAFFSLAENLVSRKERIDALELLGATFVDKKRDMLGSYKLWKRAMEERYVSLFV